MTTLRISRGAASSDVDAGVYEVVLAAVDGPKTIYPANAPEGTDILDWRFALDDGREVQGTTSTASGPRSKMFGWLTALNSGKSPEVDDEIDTDDLIGRKAIATIEISPGGWPRIANLGAIPVAAQQRRFAAETGAPVAPGAPAARPAPVRPPQRPTTIGAQAAPTSGNIPF